MSVPRKYQTHIVKCDQCSKEYEIRATYLSGSNRVIRKHRGFEVHVITGHQGAWNNWNLCPDCITSVINKSQFNPSIIYGSNYVFNTTTLYLHPYEVTKRALIGKL